MYFVSKDDRKGVNKRSSYSRSRKHERFAKSLRSGTFMKKRNPGFKNRVVSREEEAEKERKFDDYSYDIPYSINKKKRWKTIDPLKKNLSKKSCRKQKENLLLIVDDHLICGLEGDTIREQEKAVNCIERRMSRIDKIEKTSSLKCTCSFHTKKSRKGKDLKHYRCQRKVYLNQLHYNWDDYLNSWKVEGCENLLLISNYYYQEGKEKRKVMNSKRGGVSNFRRKIRKKKNLELKRNHWDYFSQIN